MWLASLVNFTGSVMKVEGAQKKEKLKRGGDLKRRNVELESRRSARPNIEKLCRAYDELRVEITAYLTNKLGLSFSESEDVVQSAFEKAIQLSEGELDKIKNARAFMYRSAYNAGVDYCRHAQVGRRHVEQVCEEPRRFVDHVDPSREVSSKQEMNIVLSALRKMPEKRRKLILMNRVQDLSYAEIARRLGLSETVVRKHVSRAVSDLLSTLRIRSGENQK